MTDPTITDAIPNAAPMIVLGGGSLAASAMIAAGQLSTAMTIVEPLSGKPNLSAVTPEELLKVPDPTLKLEIAPNTPQMTIGTSGPSMGRPGGR